MSEKFFDLINQEFVPNRQMVNTKFYLEVMKRLMNRIRRTQPEYRPSGQESLA